MHETTTSPGQERCHPLVRAGAVVAIAAMMLFTAACGGSDNESGSAASGGSSGEVDAGKVLGTQDKATGTPIRVGTVSDGRTPAFDNTMQLRMAAATAKYINDYKGGIGGHPIELVTCETGADPGKATDCANKLVREQVSLAVMGESTAALTVHKALSAQKIPMFAYGSADQDVLLDKDYAFTFASSAGLADLPINVAKENDLKKVTAIVIDVPAATVFFKSIGKKMFTDKGVDMSLVAIPPGTADITPQMSKVDEDSVAHIIGDDSLCIAALNGLKAAGFQGPRTVLNNCVDDTVRKAVGVTMKDVVEASPSPIGDPDDADQKLMKAVIETYGTGDIDPGSALTNNMFMTMMGARIALDGLKGEVTPASIVATTKAMPLSELPNGGGLHFRCNGKAFPLTPAVCTKGTLRTSLDDKGEPTLPYKKISDTPIPG